MFVLLIFLMLIIIIMMPTVDTTAVYRAGYEQAKNIPPEYKWYILLNNNYNKKEEITSYV